MRGGDCGGGRSAGAVTCRRVKRRFLDRLAAVSLFLVVVNGCDRGLTFDANGTPHGTGERVYKYPSGAAKLREEYKRGKLVRSRWFKPDGTLVQVTDWIDGSGEGIYLRDDGSIRERVTYIHGIAEGPGTKFDEAGNATSVFYHAGQQLKPSSAPATHPSK